MKTREVSVEEKGWRPGETVKTGTEVGWPPGKFPSSRKGDEAFGESWKDREENDFVRVTDESSSTEDSGDTSFFGTAGGQHQFSVSHRVNVQKKSILPCLSLIRRVLYHLENSTIWTHYITLCFLSGCVWSVTKTVIRLWGRSLIPLDACVLNNYTHVWY